MRKRQIPEQSIQHFKELLDNQEDLISVAFFIKEAGQVVVLGDVAGVGLASQANNIWDAVQSFDIIARLSDKEIAAQFGDEVVQLDADDEELMAKTAAIESLRDSLKGRRGITDVRGTPTSIAVILSGEEQYDGPWEWEGYSVYAETEV